MSATTLPFNEDNLMTTGYNNTKTPTLRHMEKQPLPYDEW